MKEYARKTFILLVCKKCENKTPVENVNVKTFSLSISCLLIQEQLRVTDCTYSIWLKEGFCLHTAVENSILIDTSLGLAYLLAALSTSATSLLSPSSPSENQSSIKMSYGMPPVLKIHVRRIESERNKVIQMTTLGA